MNGISDRFNIAFQEIIDDLLEGETPINSRYLDRLSDLVEEESILLRKVWPDILEWRRQALLEDLEALFAIDTLLSFEEVSRIALEDSNPQIRFLALRSLQDYEVPDLIPTLIQTMQEDEDEELRALAVTNLGKYIYLGEVESIPKHKQKAIEDSLFEVAQGTGSALVRRKAVEALGFSSHEGVPDLIIQAYKSEQEEWVASALLAMGRSIDPRWEPEIQEMLGSSNQEIRFEAIRAAGELELSSTRPQLIEYLHQGDRDIRMAAIWSLAQIGGENIYSIFEDLLHQDEDQEDALIIEEAMDHLLFNQSINSLHDLDFRSLEENKDY